MIRVSKNQFPSVAIILIGLYLGLREILSYAQYISDPPSHKLGLLVEFILLGFLLSSCILIAIGIRGLRREQTALPLAVLVGISLLWGTFAVDLYSISSNTQFVVSLGLAVSILPAVGTYVLFRYLCHRTD
jgi:hypothetical protein